MNFAHALTLAKYNWPLYVITAMGVLVGSSVAYFSNVAALRFLGIAGASVAAWYALASFLAFHMMFDRSNLLSGKWLPEMLAHAPDRWVQICVCLEETTLPLANVFPESEGVLLDLFNPDVMPEPAVTRARQSNSGNDAIVVRPDSLSVEDNWSDLVVVTLAAHEIRDELMREKLICELRRISTENGRLIVVEHLRNLAALLAFGHGLFHFYPRREWIRLGQLARLELESERAITPFVHVFKFKPTRDRDQSGCFPGRPEQSC